VGAIAFYFTLRNPTATPKVVILSMNRRIKTALAATSAMLLVAAPAAANDGAEEVDLFAEFSASPDQDAFIEALPEEQQAELLEELFEQAEFEVVDDSTQQTVQPSLLAEPQAGQVVNNSMSYQTVTEARWFVRGVNFDLARFQTIHTWSSNGTTVTDVQQDSIGLSTAPLVSFNAEEQGVVGIVGQDSSVTSTINREYCAEASIGPVGAGNCNQFGSTRTLTAAGSSF